MSPYPALIWDFLMETIVAKDHEIEDLQERLDPENFCNECGYIELAWEADRGHHPLPGRDP